MQVIKNKALLVSLADPKQVTSVIPKSEAVGTDAVVVNWGIDEAHKLRTLQIPAPSPIEGRYAWTGRHIPFDHQKKTAAFLTMNRKGFCFNEQGTGKTASAIWAADYLMKVGKIRRALVICPLSIMDSAWRGDLQTFAPHRSVDIAYGTAQKRRAIIEQGRDFVIHKLRWRKYNFG